MALRLGLVLTIQQQQWEQARAVLPADVLDYYASGAGDELATAEAQQAWSRYRLRPLVLRDVGTVDLATDLLGCSLRVPVGIAPMAFHALAHADGETATAGGAGQVGALTVVSTRASLAVEDIASAMTAPWWFQVYVMHDRGLTRALVQRAAEAGARALVLTGDTPYVGIKRRVSGVRYAVPQEQFLVNLSRHLVAGAVAGEAAAQDPTVTLDAVQWLAEVSGLPVLVKGVLRGDEARACLDAGAAGIVVSNHGGRQLSRAVSTAVALPEVVAAVGGHAPVLVDGGLRCGADVLVALAIGADAVLLGRPVLWALASGGADSVADMLGAVCDDLRHVLALCGVTTPAGARRESLVTTGDVVPLR